MKGVAIGLRAALWAAGVALGGLLLSSLFRQPMTSRQAAALVIFTLLSVVRPADALLLVAAFGPIINNSANVQVTTGTLSLNGGGTHTGNFDAVSPGAIAFNASMADMIKSDQPPTPPPAMEGTTPLLPPPGQPAPPPANPAPTGP